MPEKKKYVVFNNQLIERTEGNILVSDLSGLNDQLLELIQRFCNYINKKELELKKTYVDDGYVISIKSMEISTMLSMCMLSNEIISTFGDKVLVSKRSIDFLLPTE